MPLAEESSRYPMTDRPSLDTVLAGGSAAFRKLNPQLTGWVKIGDGSKTRIESVKTTSKKRLRQSDKPLLNKLETEFFAYIQGQNPSVTIRPQAKRYELARGIWYKPDFTAIIGGFEHCWEVKGPKVFRGGFENLKVAARVWPDAYWWLCSKDKRAWQFQRVIA